MLVYKVQEEERSDPSWADVEVPGEQHNLDSLQANEDGSKTRKIWKNGLALSYPFLSSFVCSFNCRLPAFLQRLVDQDNHKFEEWCSEMADMRKQSVDKGKAKHEEVKELYELLPARDGR